MTKVALAHWGAYEIGSDGVLRGTATDPDPSGIGLAADALRSDRVLAPMVRRSWLDHGIFSHPERRGVDDLVPVEWDRALDIVAEAFDTIRRDHGNESIFAGSYGWASAGRFHHAQSQLKRFLNCLGGYVDSVGTYSTGAAEVVAPRVTGLSEAEFERIAPPLEDVVANAELFVSFGGFPAGNTQVAGGGPTEHLYRPSLRALRDRGCRFVTIGPLRGAFDRELGAEWIPMRPGTDAAMMIALAAESAGRGALSTGTASLYANDLGPFLAYLRGDDTGTPRDATWAASICDVAPAVIRELAADLGKRRSLVNATWSTQRTENGEQAVWSLLALGVVLGQLGRPGCGVAFGYGSMGSIGDPAVRPNLPALPRGANPVKVTIPVSRLADALEAPGDQYMFNGGSASFPDIRLIWWCGGNPFHHAQDLNRMARAFTLPRAVIVNEPYMTATAARADVVLASTVGAERRDIGGASTGRHIVVTTPVGPRPGDARDDHEIFAGLARRLGVEREFTSGRAPEEWLKSLYEEAVANEPSPLPSWDEASADGMVERGATGSTGRLAAFMADPGGCPLPTASGRLEITVHDAERLLGAGARAHPAWYEPTEWLGTASPGQLHLVTPMPSTRLHSQFAALECEVPPARLNAASARAALVTDGQEVRVANDRGSCAARIVVTPDVANGVVVIENGRWLDVDATGHCRRGNVNVVTSDRPTSSWGQATAAHNCLVRIEPAYASTGVSGSIPAPSTLL